MVDERYGGGEAQPVGGAHEVPPYARLYDQAFHVDPDAAYERLRAGGRVAWVEIEPGVRAVLVLDYDLILVISRDASDTWTRRTSRWSAWSAGLVRPDSETAAMVAQRPNMLFAEGPEHRRLRAPVDTALRRIDMRELQARVEQAAMDLIDRCAEHGRAELVGEYAVVLPLMAMSWLFGLDEMERWRLPDIMRRIWDADGDAARAADDLARLMDSTVRRHSRGHASGPLTTGLLASSDTLRHEEIVATLVLTVGAGSQPAANLIANTVYEIVTDPQVRDDLRTSALRVPDVVHHVLWARPPIAHYPPLVARRDTVVDGVTIPRGTLVLLGLGPAGHRIHQAHGRPLHNRAYPAFGVGEHRCPADRHALAIAQTAVTTLLRELPDLRLAVPADQVTWRASPFARALYRLDVEFTPRSPSFPVSHPAQKGGPGWQQPQPFGNSRPAPTSTAPSPRGSGAWARLFGSRSRGTSRRGR
ncbi:cytochrome P450 [Actinomadura sp. NBRC 104425]|uniref:hypothetical protein n=1 Tax=Actinomadura sp. NBRC 104425 TaxID=3032204 RepID=UPI0024A03559|nr:hypothetical protein [Actinomadura sp. NBRC 104425]GLZ16052.1 cytochrome P450 [Actinomadura sp. NBRC 104425]